ncbi:hypothetical protein DRJ19_01140 [Candidatus Woesearchaeota archaeon]|nr:MAG: hypothetical protein DRJ19_01140 [Candidatus Woesearchaeota archaeon]
MLIKKVRLENIRSYVDATVCFSKGSTLLAGDIGSGKSSILLAIEFALFGLGNISGDALLRHGKQHGSVELHFEVDGKDVIIRRELKRHRRKEQQEATQQESGYIIIDGNKRVGTPQELKAIVFKLLGYPKDLLKKRKNLVYRYTVYTPQEEMKMILLESPEERKKVLRKVFGIEKYELLIQNANTILKEIKGRINLLEELSKDLGEKEKELLSLKEEKQKIESEISIFEKELNEVMRLKNEKKKALEHFENEIKELNKVKELLAKLKTEYATNEEALKKRDAELNDVTRRYEQIKKELAGATLHDAKILQDELKIKEKELKQRLEANQQKREEISSLKSQIKEREDVKNRILRLARCPLCDQEVSKEHKDEIVNRENSKIKILNEKIALLEKEVKDNEKIIEVLEQEISSIRVKHIEAEKRTKDFEMLKFLETKISELKELKENLLKKSSQLNEEIKNLYSEIDSKKELESEYKALKKEFELILDKEKRILAKFEAKKQERRFTESKINECEKMIREKKEKAELAKKLKRFSVWMKDFLIPLMEIIEQHIMAKAQQEVDLLFREWFNMLVEDEQLQARIDEDFTPVIEQNGYETNIEFLSGGERTAAALAYRLALNKVINDLMVIKTKNIIILDEPTDGFSSEQLDKMRDVLEQLNAEQIIIVSHEKKIESFVDNIIRITKNEHRSEIIQ